MSGIRKPPNPRLFDRDTAYESIRTDITLRDLFALAALAGGLMEHDGSFEEMAQDAYGVADAMLEERER